MAIPAIILAAMRAIGVGAEAAGSAAAAGTGARAAASFAGENVFSKLGAYSASGKPMPLSPNLQEAQKAAAQQKLMNEQTQATTKRWGDLTDRLKNVNQQLAFANVNVHQFAQQFEAVPAKLTQVATAWADFVSAAARPVQNLVRVANPAQADAFDRAIRDAYGVVGRLLIPVMEAFTRLARKVGDTMAGLEPVFNKAVNAAAQFIDVVGDTFVYTIQQNKDAFDALAASLRVTAGMATGFVAALKPLMGMLGGFTHYLLNPIFGTSQFDPNASSTGAAARNARFVSAKELSDEAIKNALMMGIGQKEDPQKKSANLLQDIFDWLRRRFGEGGEVNRAGSGAINATVGSAEAAGVLPGGSAALTDRFKSGAVRIFGFGG